jgi:hypothetical protein
MEEDEAVAANAVRHHRVRGGQLLLSRLGSSIHWSSMSMLTAWRSVTNIAAHVRATQLNPAPNAMSATVPLAQSVKSGRVFLENARYRSGEKTTIFGHAFQREDLDRGIPVVIVGTDD